MTELHDPSQMQKHAKPVACYFVNGTEFKSDDGKQTPREILGTARYLPPDQHLLIQIVDGHTIAHGLDEKIKLSKDQPAYFRAFEGDRVFSFTVDQIGWVWGKESIDEPEAREIAKLPKDKIFVVERKDEADERIRDGGEIQLNPEGAERVYTAPRPIVAIKVNDKPVQVPWGWSTGAMVKAAAIEQGVNIKEDFELSLDLDGDDDPIIGDDDRIFLEGDECFDAVDNHDDS